jgi:hypothetical protein
MLFTATRRMLSAMTITISPNTSTTGESADAVLLDGGLFFQPLPVVEHAWQLARDGVDVVVTLPLSRLDNPRKVRGAVGCFQPRPPAERAPPRESHADRCRDPVLGFT